MKQHPTGDVNQKAGLLKRAVALIVDQILIGIVTGAVLFGFRFAFSFGPGADGAAGLPVVVSLLSFALLLGYFVVLEAVFGYTLGKALVGIVVVSEDGSATGWGESIIRNLLRIVDSLPAALYLVGVVTVVLTDDEQRIGDLAASTLVVEQS